MFWGGIQVSAKLTGFIPIVAAIIALALTPLLANAESSIGAPRLAALIAQSAAVSPSSDTGPVVLAHLDEQSVPSAQNPGSDPALDATVPDVNPGPSADWDRVPDDSAASLSGNPANGGNPSAPAPNSQSGSSTSAGPIAVSTRPETASAPARVNTMTTSAGVHPANLTIGPKSNAPPPAPIASGTGSSTNTSVAANNPGVGAMDGDGGENASAGPPPALDLGTMQGSPDLAAASLNDEIKKADTPARAAALRVTEQARTELQAGKTDDAIRDLGRAVSIDPGNPFEYLYLGRAYIARRNYAQALIFLRRAEIGFATRPDWLGATVGFEGACYEELGRNPEAALAYQRALGTAPSNLTARVGYSRLASYLPSPPAPVEAAAPPSRDAPPPPEHDAAKPAPSEAAPLPPPAPLPQNDAPNHNGDAPTD
jgi:tetratricopeptide repeat protein